MRCARAFQVERDLALAADRAVDGDAAEHEIGVGDRRLGAAAADSRSGRAPTPALRGPTSRMPPRSIDAMLPPPAPIVCTSIIGRRSGTRKSRSVFSATRGSLLITTATSKLVPPMSAVMMLSKPGLLRRARRPR